MKHCVGSRGACSRGEKLSALVEAVDEDQLVNCPLQLDIAREGILALGRRSPAPMGADSLAGIRMVE